MIIFHKLKYSNFLSVGNVPIEINLDAPGSTLCIGGNGNGKSVLLDALTFVLYGKAYRDINKPRLVNSINKQKLLVELTFEVGGKQYLIKRGIKPAIFEISCDDKLIPQDADSYDYQDILETTILKMNYKAYTQIVVLGSATYIPFMHLKPAPRREVIEEILHLQVFTQMNIQLSEIVKEAKAQLLDLNNNISLSEEKIKFIRNNLAKVLRNTTDILDSKNQQIQNYIEQHRAALQNYKTLKVDIDLLQESYETIVINANNKKQKLITIQNKIEERRRSINKDLTFFSTTSNCPTCAQNIEDGHKHSIVTTHSKTLQDFDFAADQVKSKLDNLNFILKEQEPVKKELVEKTALFHEAKITCQHTALVVEELKKEIKRIKDQHEETSEDVGQVDVIQKELDKYVEEREKLLSNNTMYKIAALLLKDSGIKANLIKQYIPIMNGYIAKYLAEMDFFIGFEIDEQFEEKIKSRYRDDFVYNSLSQGEKFRIDLALLLTLRAIAKIRNSCTSNLLILDEIFDSSLDREGIDNFIKIINMLVQEGQSILVVSHKTDELLDKFDTVYKFSKPGNFTVMEKI